MSWHMPSVERCLGSWGYCLPHVAYHIVADGLPSIPSGNYHWRCWFDLSQPLASVEYLPDSFTLVLRYCYSDCFAFFDVLSTLPFRRKDVLDLLSAFGCVSAETLSVSISDFYLNRLYREDSPTYERVMCDRNLVLLYGWPLDGLDAYYEYLSYQARLC